MPDPFNGVLMGQPAGVLATRSPYGQAPSPMSGYQTALNPLEKMAFEQWLQKNNVPHNPGPTSDYDMQGFYKALTSGDPMAKNSVNPNDGQMHFPDYWKTPYHESFSAESKYAKPDAPQWNQRDQLVDKSGNVVFDERFNQAILRSR